jgi:hypothetical protein
MAALLAAWRNSGGNDDIQLRRWLSRRDLPYAHYQIDWACDAIIDGIETVPADERPFLRVALARSLARILDSEPERATAREWNPHRDGGQALTNIYALAIALDQPQALADAVARAFLRGVPDIPGEHAPVARRLFDAAMMTQVDNRLASCWAALRSHAPDPDLQVPNAVRNTNWGIMWWDIWAATVRVPGPQDQFGTSSGPSRQAIARALPWLAKAIETYKLTNAERLARLEFELGRIDSAWLTDWRPLLAPMWLFLDLPSWVAPLFFRGATAEWKPEPEMIARLKRLRTAVQSANWDDPEIETTNYEPWMEPYVVLVGDKDLPDMDGTMTKEKSVKFISSFWFSHIECNTISPSDYKILIGDFKRTTAYALVKEDV